VLTTAQVAFVNVHSGIREMYMPYDWQTKTASDPVRRPVNTMRLEFSAPLCHKILAFFIQAPK
jgi:hypothetical protein